MNKKHDYDYYLKRFQEVVCFLTAVNIKQDFHTLAEYKKANNSSKAYHLHIQWRILHRLSRLSQGKKCFEAFLASSKSLFEYHRHVHKKYNSNKKFVRNSWFELSEDMLAVWFSDDKNFSTTTCKLISASTHKWLDKYIYLPKYKGKNKSETKAEDKSETKPVINKITEDDIDKEEVSPLIDETWWQEQINNMNFSKGFAQKIYMMLTGHKIDFKESKSGWTPEDSIRTSIIRRAVCKSILEKQDTYNLTEESVTSLKKMCL